MIDKIYILNLKTERERFIYCHLGLREHGFEGDLIDIWEAKDNFNHFKTANLCQEAADDGFPFFQHLLDTEKNTDCYIAYLAQFWGYLAFLRHVKENNINAILFFDDQEFKCSLDALKNALSLLPNKKKLSAAFLSCVLQDQENIEFIDNSCWAPFDGRYCLDGAVLWTPRGADIVLDYFSNYKERACEGWFFEILRRNQEHFVDNGFYGLVINPKHLGNMEKIKKYLDCFGGYDLAAVTNGYAADKSMIHTQRGKPFRGKEA